MTQGASSTEAPPGSLRAFLRTEVGSTAVLLGATVIALLWANSPFGDTYEALWNTPLTLQLGGTELGLDLRYWVNDGLMALFFFVIGLELSRELTRGEMRDRRLVAVPALAALGGMTVPALIYLAFNAGGPGQAGWAIPIATDTAFALGVLAVVGARCPTPLRVFLLTAVVADDVGAILVIAGVYTRDIQPSALLVAIGLFAVVVVLRRLRVRRGALFVVLALAIWVAALQSGVHPTVVGIAMGLLAPAYAPVEKRLRHAGEFFREFARDPTPERARTASLLVRGTISPNDRLQLLLHPWTSYVILPVFALANAGVRLDPATLAQAVTSPVTWGVVAGLAGGKLAGITGGAWVALRTRLGILPGNLVWGQVAGGAAVAGIGFTLSLFIADLAFTSETVIAEAKVGILFGSLLAAALGWVVFRLAWNRGAVCAPPPGPGDAMVAEPPSDVLADQVGPRDHVRGSDDATATLVEYGDFECPYCGQAAPMVEELLERFDGELRFVFRHFPLPSVHPHAPAAARAAEAAAAHSRFWPMYDSLFANQTALTDEDLAGHAERVGVPVREAVGEPAQHHDQRVEADVDSGRRSGVRGTPAFFINGRRYRGNHDLEAFAAAIERARSDEVV